MLGEDLFAGFFGGSVYRRQVSQMITAVEDYIEFPFEFSLSQNYPNPFNPSTKISWQSPVSGWQILKVYDILGSEVVILVNEFGPAGRYEIEFSATNLSSGVYFYRLQAGNYTDTKKVILMR